MIQGKTTHTLIRLEKADIFMYCDSSHCPQGGSEPGLNGLNNLYIQVDDDCGPSAETCIDRVPIMSGSDVTG